MTEPLGSVQPQAASSAVSSVQRIDTATGDQAQPRSELNSDQTAVEIGGSIPLVFGVRQGTTGGVWVNPPASEARLENDLQNRVSIWYELIVSDGEIGSINPADVFQGDRQRGTASFAFNARAGSWDPGSFLQQRWKTIESTEVNEISSGPDQTLELTIRSRGSHVTYFEVEHENVSPGAGLTSLDNYLATAQVSLSGFQPEPSFTEEGDLAGKASGGLTQYFRQTITEIDRPPYDLPDGFSYCGDGSGFYEGLSVLSYSETFPDGDDGYKRQVHVFVRNGLKVDRLIEGTVGSSDLFPDLAAHLLKQRLPSDLLDFELLEESARFCDEQDFRFNGVISTPTNIRDFLNRIAPLCLLTVTQIQGRIGLRPALPYNSSYQIYTGPTISRFQFNEENIVEGAFSMSYVPTSDRAPFIAEVLWRQQPEGNVGLIRSTKIKFGDTDDDAPIEQYDLSDFCTSHVHAVKIGAAILSRRRHVTHTASLTARPGAFAGELAPGDIVEVALSRESSVDYVAPNDHRFYYQVNSVSTNRQGSVGVELTHWPVNASGQSLIALDIANVDPGAVSSSGSGLPTAITPVDPLFDEAFFSGFFTTLTFLPNQTINGFLRVCVQASNPIKNGDLILTLSTGQKLTIEEGETVGCIDIPITTDLFEDLLPDDFTLDDLDLTLDDLTWPDLDDFLDDIGDLDGDLTVGDLDPGRLDDLEGILDLTDLELDDLLDLPLDDLEDLLNDLEIDDLTNIDLGDLDLDPLGLDINGIIIPIDQLPLDDITIGDVDAPDGYGIDLADIDSDDLGDLGDLGNINIGDFGIGIGDLDLEDVADEDACISPAPDVYFHSVGWSGYTLILQIRISPTGLSPLQKLGPLMGTVSSSKVEAYSAETNELVSPQPGSLPSLNFTGPIAYPDAFIQQGEILQGEFRIQFSENDFPAVNSGMYYSMGIELATEGGFCSSRVTNSAIAIFDDQTVILIQAIVRYKWFDGRDLDTTTSISTPINEGPVGWAHASSTGAMIWGGDNTTTAGFETVTIAIGKIQQANPDAEEVNINIAGNWYAEKGSGKVTIEVVVTGQDIPSIQASTIKTCNLVAKGGSGEGLGSVKISLRTGGITFA